MLKNVIFIQNMKLKRYLKRFKATVDR